MGEGERHIPEAVRKGDRFFSDEAFAKKVDQWKRYSSEREKNEEEADPYRDLAIRVEGDSVGVGLEELHHEYFIRDTIPQLINNSLKGKIKILDVGGGAALFAKQIRDAFGDKVEVFTTGLRKKAAKERRILSGVSPKLHQNDLKWRSVSELHDFPEFDLIIDSYGEARWGVDDFEEVRDYLVSISQKLLPGGHASIAVLPVSYFGEQSLKLFEEISNTHNVKIRYHGASIKIDKPKEIEQK